MDKFEKRKAEFMEMAKELSEQFYKKIRITMTHILIKESKVLVLINISKS